MGPRITNLMMTQRYLSDLQHTQQGLAKAQRELSSGQRIQTASDDPFGTSRQLTFDAELKDIEAYKRNVSDAQGFIEVAHSALGGITNALSRIRELTLQAANSTTDADGLRAIAQEVGQLKQQIRGDINTRFGDDYVFSGTATRTAPYPAPPGPAGYQGNQEAINRRVSPGMSMQINEDGDNVMGTTTGAAATQLDVLDLCDRIIANLNAGTPAAREELRTGVLDGLDAHIGNVLQRQANISATAGRLEVTSQRLQDLELRFTEARSEVADVDMAKTYMQFQTHNAMYEAALAAGARIMTRSLVDFL